MTAAQAVAESPTAAMLARLEAAGLSPDLFGLSTELLPWLRAATVAPFDLPAEVLAVAEQGLHLAELQQAHTAPAPHNAGDVEAILAGSTPDEIMDADNQAAVATVRHERAEFLLIAARRRLAGESGGAFGPHRDDLIVGPLREAVAALLADAKAKAATLKKFAPDYGPALLSDGNPAQLQAYRSSRELQANFATLLAAWRASWLAAGKDKSIGREFIPVRAGGFYALEDPDAVKNERLKLGQDTEVLRIASAPSRYRLISPSELAPLLEQLGEGASQRVRLGMVTSGA